MLICVEREAKVQFAIIRNNDAQITVYPNPASNHIYIKIGEERNNTDELTFELFDALGRKVLTQSLNEREAFVLIYHIPSGIYFYKIRGDKDVLKSDKILVE